MLLVSMMQGQLGSDVADGTKTGISAVRVPSLISACQLYIWLGTKIVLKYCNSFPTRSLTGV